MPCQWGFWKQSETGTRGFCFGPGHPLAGQVYCVCRQLFLWESTQVTDASHLPLLCCRGMLPCRKVLCQRQLCLLVLHSIFCLRLPSPMLCSDSDALCFSQKGRWLLMLMIWKFVGAGEAPVSWLAGAQPLHESCSSFFCDGSVWSNGQKLFWNTLAGVRDCAPGTFYPGSDKVWCFFH